MRAVGRVQQARRIETEADIATGVRALRRKCTVFRRMHDAAGDPPLRRRPAGLDGLLRIIVGQQLSIASAGAIWARLEAGLDTKDAHALAAATDDTLRGFGLSRPKVRTIRNLAAAVREGLDLEALDHASDADVHAALTAVGGIGPWTADIFLMFCLGRADAFAPGDLALQVAAEQAFALEARPSASELDELATRWRPWRGVAARQLWAYYAVQKSTATRPPPRSEDKMPV